MHVTEAPNQTFFNIQIFVDLTVFCIMWVYVDVIFGDPMYFPCLCNAYIKLITLQNTYWFDKPNSAFMGNILMSRVKYIVTIKTLQVYFEHT